MEESIHFFRSIGFFESFRDLGDREVLDRPHEKKEKAIRDIWKGIDGNEGSEGSWILETKDASGASSTSLHSDPEAHPGSVPYTDCMRRERQEMLDRMPINRMFDRENALQDLWIAAEDETRVWYHDLEAGAGPNSEAYVDALKDWGRISRRAFEPKDIRETWTAF